MEEPTSPRETASASNSFDEWLASDASTVAEEDSLLFADSDELLDEDTLRVLEAELDLTNLDVDSEEIERLLDNAEEDGLSDEDPALRSKPVFRAAPPEQIRGAADERLVRDVGDIERAVSDPSESDLSWIDSLLGSESLSTTDSFASPFSTIEPAHALGEARERPWVQQRRRWSQWQRLPPLRVRDRALSETSVSTISPVQARDTERLLTPSTSVPSTRASPRRWHSSMPMDRTALTTKSTFKPWGTRLRSHSPTAESRWWNAELDRLARDLQSSLIHEQEAATGVASGHSSDRPGTRWYTHEAQSMPRLLPRFSGDSLSSLASPSSMETDNVSPTEGNEMVSAAGDAAG
ncbi:hypothetical protein F1559_001202 [Cyanidiococcus yangmingshanensis]|uniref:Uncharacterized protein n=1 Tax=Cyanidiococcus yangmingshanensis TaxID=2690220 RepID=A0A7J7ICT3_9RHOD|nr:hypothetical protein F1559_001202 [Cyanidiococcus yangmingshanensis]